MNKIDGIKCQYNYKIIFVIGHVYLRLLECLPQRANYKLMVVHDMLSRYEHHHYRRHDQRQEEKPSRTSAC